MQIAAHGQQLGALPDEAQALFLAPGGKAKRDVMRARVRDDAVYHLYHLGMAGLRGKAHEARHIRRPNEDSIETLRGQNLINVGSRFGGLDLDDQTDRGIRFADIFTEVFEVTAGTNGRES